MEEGRWTLELPRPYSLAITVQLLRRTPSNLVNRWEADRYIRGMRTPQGNCLVTVRQCGSIEASSAEVTIYAPEISERLHADVVAILRRVLGLDVEVAELSARFDLEPRLDRCRPTRWSDQGIRRSGEPASSASSRWTPPESREASQASPFVWARHISPIPGKLLTDAEALERRAPGWEVRNTVDLGRRVLRESRRRRLLTPALTEVGGG